MESQVKNSQKWNRFGSKFCLEGDVITSDGNPKDTEEADCEAENVDAEHFESIFLILLGHSDAMPELGQLKIHTFY